MYPIALNLNVIPLLLAGRGELLDRRIQMLKDGGATDLTVVEVPTDEEISTAKVVMVAGLNREEAEVVASKARAGGKLVNVEDVNDLCDFYFTANVRRGDLILSVSTSGASPVLARRMKEYLAERFGPEWAGYTQELKDKRAQWRAEGKGFRELVNAGEAMLRDKGWLDCSKNCPSKKDAA